MSTSAPPNQSLPPDTQVVPVVSCEVVTEGLSFAGEMLAVIQLANLPSESAMAPHEQRMISSLRYIHRPPGRSPWTGRCVDWAHDLASYVLAPFQDRRLIPRLAIRTNCAMLDADTLRQGTTRDLSYSGASVLFSDFSPDNLSGRCFASNSSR